MHCVPFAVYAFAPMQKCVSALKKATTSELSCADHPGPWNFTNDTGTFPEPGSSGITCLDYGATVKGVAKVPCTATAKAYCPKTCGECVACANLFACMEECTHDVVNITAAAVVPTVNISAAACGMFFQIYACRPPPPPPALLRESTPSAFPSRARVRTHPPPLLGCVNVLPSSPPLPASYQLWEEGAHPLPSPPPAPMRPLLSTCPAP
jgi:hypothetical protein